MNMSATEILGLQWLEHPRIFNQAIVELRNKNTFTDATLACEGKFYPVHKFVLSTCSDYFSAIFEWTPCVNPVVVINNISQHHLEPLLDFMYKGETSVQECFIQDVMKAAECLHIKGLSIRQDDINFAKNRNKSPEEFDEPKKKRRKSETIKKPFLKPQLLQECFFGQQSSSPIHSSISSSRPTPTPPPPTTPIHHTSPHHTPPIHSPLHSASPHAHSAASSPASQNQFQTAPHQIPSPKPLTSPLQQSNSQNQQARNVSQYKDNVTATLPSQLQIPSQHYETYSTQPRDQYSCNKGEQTSLVYSALSNTVSTINSSIMSASHVPQYRKYSSSLMGDKLHGIQNAGMGGGGVVVPVLPHMPVEQKIMGIGEELHLDGPVKELEIATEDGTVSLPEILEDWVDMRHLYEPKHQSEAFNHETKPTVMEVLPQCSNSSSESAVHILHFKEEINDNMYEFTEDFQDDAGAEKMKLLKEKNQRVYSNNGTPSRRKNNNELQIDPTASGSDISNASTGPSPTPTSSGEKAEAKGPFVCGTCNRVCKKKDSLTRHMRTHSEFPYTCTVCQHKCKVYKDYILHRKTHATKRCDKCDFVTIRGDALRRHMTSTHSEGKAQKCPYSECAFTTSKANLLSSHIHTHQPKKEEENPAEEQ